jgi:dihydroorotate dehydrogenase (NAD+) catalytic subunit
MKNLAVTNSFGMPSRTPQYLREDIPKAQASLKEGQMMIVSVVGIFVSFNFP